MKKVFEIFMEDDREGLKALYEETKDELCQIALNWLENIYEIRYVNTNEYSMYDDIISYLWEKYNK